MACICTRFQYWHVGESTHVFCYKASEKEQKIWSAKVQNIKVLNIATAITGVISHYAETLQYAMEKALADKTSIVKNLVSK